MGRRRTRLAPEVRRAAVLDAAADVFRAKGFADTTMDDVARRAGVAKGTVYLYFGSKEDLAGALWDRYLSDLEALAERHLAPDEPDRLRRLRRFLDGMAEVHLRHAETLHAVLHGAPVESGPSERFVGALEAFVDAGRRSGEFRVPDARATTRFLIDGLHGVLLVAQHEGYDERRLRSTLRTLAGNVLGAAP